VHGTLTDEAGRRSTNVIHRGPAMVAPITREDKFCGLHVTYLTEDGAKLSLCDPETRELLPAKKVRGSKSAGAIETYQGCGTGRTINCTASKSRTASSMQSVVNGSPTLSFQ
jgi:hypothetical protein